MRINKTEGIIIKRRNSQEADKLLTILTKTEGKIFIKAPGIRKITSRRSPHVELLNRANLTLYQNGHIPILSEAEMISDYELIKSDLSKIGYSYHLCELIDGLCPENEANEEVYLLLVETLDSLCVSDRVSDLIHDFELRLLNILGFGHRRMWSDEYFNLHLYIESIMEKKLKAKEIFLHDI